MRVAVLILLLGFYQLAYSDKGQNDEDLENLIKLEMRDDLPVCHHMAELINRDMNLLKRNGTLYEYWDISYKDHVEFTSIPWEKRKMILTNHLTGLDVREDWWRIAFFDLNNDSKKEWVSIQQSTPDGNLVFRMAVHDEDLAYKHRIDGAYYLDTWVLGENGGRIQLWPDANRYNWQARKINAFIYEGRTYLLLTETDRGNTFIIAEVNSDYSEILDLEEKKLQQTMPGVTSLCLIQTSK